MVNLCQSKESAPGQCECSENVACTEPWTVESLWRQREAKVSREVRKEQPGVPQPGTVRAGEEEGSQPASGALSHWQSSGKFGFESLGLRLRLRSEADRPHYHGV